MQQALHYRRKRKHAQKVVRAPWYVRMLDIVVYPIGIAGIIAGIPQVLAIWIDHQAEGVSIASWALWAVFSVFWTLYWIVHKEPVVVFVNGVWIVMNSMIALGAYLYG